MHFHDLSKKKSSQLNVWIFSSTGNNTLNCGVIPDHGSAVTIYDVPYSLHKEFAYVLKTYTLKVEIRRKSFSLSLVSQLVLV